MALTSDLDRVAMIVLRYMRRPLFALLLVYAVGIIGMALIPGPVVDGRTTYMSLFHAFYFFTYTATTTGFGEIPNGFSDEQRLWTIFCLYTGVIAWFYAIGSLIRLLQNPHFTQALHEYRFARAVAATPEPFVILCGFGDTGSLLARGLSDHRMRAVVLDADPERIKALAVRDYDVAMPGLCADAGAPKHLVEAGVKHPRASAIVALTNDDDVNLRIAVMARHLNPEIEVICRSTSARHEASLRALDNVRVVDPFEIFAQLVCRTIAAPRLHNLNAWLVGAHGVALGAPLQVPPGEWILCGYGRMGRWIHEHMRANGIGARIIDPEADPPDAETPFVQAHADPAALEAAGVADAAGIVAGTNSDPDNLSTLLALPDDERRPFCIVRQNSHANQLAFDAARADLVLQHSLTTARRILKLLVSPQIQELIDYLADQAEPAVLDQLVTRLQVAVGAEAPHLWTASIGTQASPAVAEYLDAGGTVTVGDLCRDARDYPAQLPCEVLAVRREGDSLLLPAPDAPVALGDQLLFCGQERAEPLVAATLGNPYTLDYVITGIDRPRGHVFRWIERWRRGHQPHVTATR